jgi:iron complex outermembrane receptor protein
MNILFYKKKQEPRTKSSLAAVFFFLLIATFSFSQETKKDTLKTNALDEVLISAIRITKKTPISFSNMDKVEIAYRNLGQDIPILLNFLPSVVTTSDAGNGFGYTGIRVRGSDATRVNVTINGIPYNDSEGSGTFFVDLPDFASSLSSIQLQRGVGTSTNGAGAFGASLNMLTDNHSTIGSAEIANAMGSFNSRKSNVKFSTGLLNNHFEISGRLSNLHSDGYVDRAFSDLKSYFLQGTYIGKTTLIKALVFGGTEKTYQSWYGVDAVTLANDRTFNYAGMFTDSFGQTQFYSNQTDNYQQDHYQLHWNEKLAPNWNTNLAFHYTKGKGYYENYEQAAAFDDYGFSPIIIGNETINATDLINQKWLDNDFFGTTFSVNYKKESLDFIFGGSINKYEGLHFGKVIWARFASSSELDNHYYDNYGNKFDATFYAKANYQLNSNWNIFADLQYRNVNYKANGVQPNAVNDSFNFANPKAGVTYEFRKNNQIYFSYAMANREPNRTDYENGSPKSEQLNDFELGWRFEKGKSKININGYYMSYKDQLVLTGALDNVGNPIRTNIGKSFRLGIELDANFELGKQWILSPNLALSQNKNVDFVIDNGTSLEFLGNTNIAFSPNIIAGNTLSFLPTKAFQVRLLTKFVGKQYMGNSDDESSKLDAYSQNDINLIYEIKPKNIFKSIVFSGLINNVLDAKIVSNGADYGGGYVYYFPQAGINFLAGITLKF